MIKHMRYFSYQKDILCRFIRFIKNFIDKLNKTFKFQFDLNEHVSMSQIDFARYKQIRGTH